MREITWVERGCRKTVHSFSLEVSTKVTNITFISHEGLCRWWESHKEIPVGLQFSLKLRYMQLPPEARRGRPKAA